MATPVTSFEGRLLRAGILSGTSLSDPPTVEIEVNWKQLLDLTVNPIFQQVRVEILPPVEVKKPE